MEDEGVYTCVAHNVVGRSKIDIELDVQSKFPLNICDDLVGTYSLRNPQIEMVFNVILHV